MTTADEVRMKQHFAARALWPVWRSYQRAADYLPYLLFMDLPRVNADADPPPETHSQSTQPKE